MASAGYNISSIDASEDEVDHTLSHVTIVVDRDDSLERVAASNNDSSSSSGAGGFSTTTRTRDDHHRTSSFLFFGSSKKRNYSLRRNNIVVAGGGSTNDTSSAFPFPSAQDITDVAWLDEDRHIASLLGVIGQLPEVLAVTPVSEDCLLSDEFFITTPVQEEESTDEEEEGEENVGLVYLVHDFASAPSWGFTSHYDVLPRDPYVRGIGVGRFREYSKYRFVFPPRRSNYQMPPGSATATSTAAVDQADDEKRRRMYGTVKKGGVEVSTHVSKSPEKKSPLYGTVKKGGVEVTDDLIHMHTDDNYYYDKVKIQEGSAALKKKFVHLLSNNNNDADTAADDNNLGFYIPIDLDAAGGVLFEMPDEKFNQPAGYVFSGRADNAAGGKEYRTADRKFRRLSPGLVRLPEFKEIIRRFAAQVRLDPRYARRDHLDLGVHAIRIVADEVGAGNAEHEKMLGQIVPEGMHRDGFQYVCIVITGRSNIQDFNAYVYMAGPNGSRPPKDIEPLFRHNLLTGQALFLDDTRVWHDADDIRQVKLDEPGYCDFIVLTFTAEEQQKNEDLQ